MLLIYDNTVNDTENVTCVTAKLDEQGMCRAVGSLSLSRGRNS